MSTDLLPEITLPPTEDVEESVHMEVKDLPEPKVTFVDEMDAPKADTTDIPIEPKHTEENEDIFKEEKPKRKPRPRKGELTQKQSDHLKKAREKGLAVRRKKAAERAAAKIEEDEIKEEVRLKREKESLMKKHKVTQPVKKVYELDAEMIKQLKEDAIEGYDNKRKARKAKKKEEQKKDAVEAKTFDVITKAVGGVDPDKVYESCFGFQ
jgi:hypothetical protein